MDSEFHRGHRAAWLATRAAVEVLGPPMAPVPKYMAKWRLPSGLVLNLHRRGLEEAIFEIAGPGVEQAGVLDLLRGDIGSGRAPNDHNRSREIREGPTLAIKIRPDQIPQFQRFLREIVSGILPKVSSGSSRQTGVREIQREPGAVGRVQPVEEASAKVRDGNAPIPLREVSGPTDDRIASQQNSTPALAVGLPRVFATKVWGFEPERWAVLGFSRPGSRDALARDLRPEDWVLHIGTRVTGDTQASDRGQLLGIARLGTMAIATEAGVEPAFWQHNLERNGGKPKWPFGLPMVEAKRFIGTGLDEYQVLPSFKGANLGLVLGTNAIELSPEEAQRVLALATEPVQLYSSPEIEDARARDDLRQKLRRAPIPHKPGERTSVYEDQAAFTYVLKLVGPGVASAYGENGVGGRLPRNIFKIGYAVDVKKRAETLNFAFPNLKCLRWVPVMQQRHDTNVEAMAMEANVHALLDAYTAREAGNSETFVCEDKVLEAAWMRAIRDTHQDRSEAAVSIRQSG